MASHDDLEVTAIKERYARRQANQSDKKYPTFSNFQFFSRVEREYWMGTCLHSHFDQVGQVELLEIGAGSGANIVSFLSLGVQRQHFYANELLLDRAKSLNGLLEPRQIFLGDVLLLPDERKFDVVYLGTVFSSILDDRFQQRLAEKVWSLVKPNGLILIYDFVYSNPWNPDVRAVPIERVQQLFPKASVRSCRLTLAPPLGRRVGSFYRLFNWPILRTHRGFSILRGSLTV